MKCGPFCIGYTWALSGGIELNSYSFTPNDIRRILLNKRKVSIKEKFIFTSQSNYIFYIYIFTKYHEFLKCVQI